MKPGSGCTLIHTSLLLLMPRWDSDRRRTMHGLTFSLRRGFSLVEVLASVSILAASVALLLPAVQSARESARSIQCRNHAKQMALALHQYESIHNHFPASFFTTPLENASGSGASWSVHGRLLPYLENEPASSRISLEKDWHFQVERGVTAMQILTYQCPSEPNQRIRFKNGKPYVAGHNYGVNFGTWLVYDPNTGKQGDGAFGVNRGIRCSSIRDGLSKTLAVAEVKNYQPYLRNTNPPSSTPPSSPLELVQLGGQFKKTGHTVWPDGRVHHSGMTTTFPPNSKVNFRRDGENYDIDFNSQQEGKSDQRVSYAAVTSRSHHAGLVNVALMDGSVRSISDAIDLTIWRAAGTRDGGEVDFVWDHH